jgi:MEMO1 family protein
MRPGLPRVLVQLVVLVAVAAAVAVLVWRGKGWPERLVPEERIMSEERAAAPTPIPAEAAGARIVRPPSVAGQFYPDDPGELYREVREFLAASPTVGLRGVRAILVPHAGYVFSGEVAAAAFRELGSDFRTVFILAANHNGRADFSGVSVPEVTHYAIPGAEIPLSPIASRLRDDKLITYVPEAHTMHMIEIELPFLHVLRGRPAQANFSIVPMILGRMSDDDIDRLAALLDSYADPSTVFVFSVDLSHFYPDETAQDLDGYTVDSIMAQDREALKRATTDGNHVLATMLALARRRGWEPTFLAARNSGAVNGDKSRVVGYAAVAFHEPIEFTSEEKDTLLKFARASIEEHLRDGRAAEMRDELLQRFPLFRVPRAVFVTLEKEGRLRGCIGDLVSRAPLSSGVLKNAVAAAVEDPRFRPVTEGELGDLTITISVLGYPTRVKVDQPEQYLQVLRPGQDGVILAYQGRRSTFLPEVWKEIPDPTEFLEHLSLKQGAPRDAWRSPSAVLYRYGAHIFGEESHPATGGVGASAAAEN